jgi:hypothetical protein
MSPLYAFLTEMAADRKFVAVLAVKPSLAQSFDDLQSFFQQLEETSDSPIAIDLYDACVEIVRRQAPLKDRALAMYQVMKASLPAVPTKYGQ